MIKNSFIDYPGCISCVLFVPGCNFDCFYCHNRTLIDGTEEATISIEKIDSFLEKRKGQIDAVVISGGEPTLQPDLIAFIRYIRAKNYKVKLDTNGSNPEIVAKILAENLCDYFSVDYKAPKELYPLYCGKSVKADNVIKTILMLKDSGVSFEVRTTVFPQLNARNLIQMASELPLLDRYVLNKYRKPEHYRETDEILVSATPYTLNDIEALAESIKTIQPKVSF